MIVVTIIALLAAIAVPGFLRSRKRSQATSVLEEARVLDGALSQYAIENNCGGANPVSAQVFYPYLKDGSRLYLLSQAGTTPTDSVGNTFVINTIDSGVKVSSATTANFSDVIDDPTAFWAGYGQ